MRADVSAAEVVHFFAACGPVQQPTDVSRVGSDE